MIEEVNQKLDHKLALNHLSTRLKQVLNPTIREGEFVIGDNVGVKLITDISQDNFQSLSFSVKSFITNEFETERKTAYTIGYITNEPSLWASNLGSQSFLNIGYVFENNCVCVVLVPSEDFNILKTEAEVFISDDNKNHVVSIDYVTDVERDQYQEEDIYLPIEGEVNSNFYYKIDDGSGSYRYILPGVIDDEPIDSIRYSNHAEEAEYLDHDIEITINDNDSSQTIYGSGTLYTDQTTANLEVSIDTDPIIDAVRQSINYPIANLNNEVGGVSLIDPEDNELGVNQFPILLQDRGNEEYGAYVDINGFTVNGLDIHRYTNMYEATAEHNNLYDIVQYIGPTTDQYVRGYFYIRIRELVVGTPSLAGTNWACSDTSAFNDALTEYNRQNDHLLVINNVNKPLIITPNLTEDGTITSETEFTIRNGSFSDVLTYADILNLGISLNTLNYVHSDAQRFTLSVALTYLDPENPDNPKVWALKNVLPAIKTDSVLTYMGVCTWAELQAKTSSAHVGEFWTVSDKANQEYFFDGTSWEFMGDIFDPYTEGDGISITSTHDISVKYDNDTIKKNGSGNLYVDGILTDTTYSFSQSGNTLTITPSSGNASTYTPTFTDNDRYVNSAAFADDSTNNSSSPVKMTLTRAGSDSATVTANLPKVSSISAGVAPKGVSVSTQDNTTKFLREDGSWATPSYTTNTDEKLQISSSSTKMYLTGVDPINDGIPSTAVPGKANIGVYATNGDLHLDGNIEHNVDLFNSGTPISQDSLIRSINIDCTSKKYVHIKTNYEGNLDIHINLPASGITLNGVREVICRISNVAQSGQSLKQLTVRVNAISAETGYTHVTDLHNMYNSSITLSGYGVNVNNEEVMELVFTFWTDNDVTFNGGINV